MEKQIITGGIVVLVLAVVLPIGASSYKFGQLSSRTSSLERTVQSYHTTFSSDLGILRKEVYELKREIGEEIEAVRSEVWQLRNELSRMLTNRAS